MSDSRVSSAGAPGRAVQLGWKTAEVPCPVTVSRVELEAEAGELWLSGLRLDPQTAAAPAAESRRPIVSLHGYGSCKEELLGLGIRVVAATDRPGFLFDLPGHGESGGYFSAESVMSMKKTLGRKLFPIAVIGHSIGARVALTFEETFAALALSPPLRAEFDGDKTKLIRTLRQRRVREAKPFAGLIGVLGELGTELPATRPDQILIITAANDLPTVKEAAHAWRKKIGVSVSENLEAASHLDIVTSGELLAMAPQWIAARLTDAGSA